MRRNKKEEHEEKAEGGEEEWIHDDQSVKRTRMSSSHMMKNEPQMNKYKVIIKVCSGDS